MTTSPYTARLFAGNGSTGSLIEILVDRTPEGMPHNEVSHAGHIYALGSDRPELDVQEYFLKT
ncbi:MAG: hypothetical protein CMH38_11205 [Microbacterium sp.]|jgi:hypothetical protein|uniref:hypothetical protein n=1 Tax=unclassified Microbacterium TaxID=2609290 RepID=UPI000C393A40|nr:MULTISPECIES: hypothetical protein [unclassified Microbacterium]MAY50468.1 hypothetical protein [Microbacterium sp.]HAS30739.1 hypothetical protein [Microbacterium sp.]HBR89985.1 hypothetical protein [Microbacterium sp.]HBS74944.1 hypothetical protein [Microbacterium sp.]|tara:strand:- start:1804 stop:1992 length:189 start_codon:yes stop_codon:yes gene_type:complete